MHEIRFYRDKSGREPVVEYMEKLANTAGKDSRVKLRKIQDYINLLEKLGTQAGEPYIKHIDGDIWELRPLRDRIFFVAWVDGSYVLLHQFQKRTQKTPVREIEKAKREVADLKARA